LGVIAATDAGRRRNDRYRERLETNRTGSDATHIKVQKNTENIASDAIIDDRGTKGRDASETPENGVSPRRNRGRRHSLQLASNAYL